MQCAAKTRFGFYCNEYFTNGSEARQGKAYTAYQIVILIHFIHSIFVHSFNIVKFSLFAGFLLEGVTPTAPPDVPPRNPTMSRMNNARLIAGAVANNPNDLGVDFEPSCLVRTPSGNVYIPSGNLSE